MQDEEVVILGAGLAGLTLAYRLEKEGVPYLILEARDRIGGRIHTISTSTGATIEMGATWFAEKHTYLMNLIEELKIPYQEQYTGSRVLYDYANPGRMTQVFQLPEDNEPQFIFNRGTRSLLDALCGSVDPSRIRLGEQVGKITFGDKGATVTVNKEEIYGGKVVSTLPPNLFLNRVEVPKLPKVLAEYSGKTHTWMGDSIKVGLEYSTDFWRNHEIGSILSQFGPAQELHDHQHEDLKGHVLKGFINSSLHEKGKEHRKAQVMEQMRLYFGKDLPEAGYYEKDWHEDAHTYYPYTSEVMPHQCNGHPVFRESYFDGRLYFAGSETAQAFPGYLDGAVERGTTVALSLIKERATMNMS